MASLRDIIRQEKDEILEGITWIAIWKTGRSWHTESFYPEDGSYDDGYVFSKDDSNRMNEIIKADNNAILINGYYCGFGDTSGEDSYYNTLEAVKERALWMYNECYNMLSCFIKNNHATKKDINNDTDVESNSIEEYFRKVDIDRLFYDKTNENPMIADKNDRSKLQVYNE